MPRKATEAAATEKPAAKKRTVTRRKTSEARKVSLPMWEHVATRAYYIHLAEGGDALENWVRAERELVAA